MTGCANAIAERDRLRRRAEACQPLAYELHLRPGFLCRRLYPHSRTQCGTCAGDLLPLANPVTEDNISATKEGTNGISDD
jgi:hypothetical protein